MLASPRAGWCQRRAGAGPAPYGSSTIASGGM